MITSRSTSPAEPVCLATTPDRARVPQRADRAGAWTQLLPWIASISMHAAVLAFMFLLIFPFRPTTEAVDFTAVHAEITALPGSAGNDPPSPRTAEHQALPLESPKMHFAPARRAMPVREFRPRQGALSIVGLGVGGGEFAETGLAMGAPSGPEFFGLGASERGARRILYVVDRSGSMVGAFQYVRDELKRSISALRRSQKFHVIFFNNRAPLEKPPRRLVSAIQAHKRRFFEFLDDVYPSGGTDPRGALRLALEYDADIVYLLTDGTEFKARLLRDLDEWNRARRSKIFVIAYLDETARPLLETIAREHNGEFTFVSEDDLP